MIRCTDISLQTSAHLTRSRLNADEMRRNMRVVGNLVELPVTPYKPSVSSRLRRLASRLIDYVPAGVR